MVLCQQAEQDAERTARLFTEHPLSSPWSAMIDDKDCPVYGLMAKAERTLPRPLTLRLPENSLTPYCWMFVGAVISAYSSSIEAFSCSRDVRTVLSSRLIPLSFSSEPQTVRSSTVQLVKQIVRWTQPLACKTTQFPQEQNHYCYFLTEYNVWGFIIL